MTVGHSHALPGRPSSYRSSLARVLLRANGARVAFALLVAYLLWPMLFATQPEGFTAQIQNAAAAANAGMVDRANPLYPQHAEYFYLTRLGVIYLLQVLMQFAGTTGDVVWKVLTFASYAVFFAATLRIAKRWSGLSYGWGAAAFLLTPGYTELGFYFNDNVVSCAFGLLAIVALPPRTANSAATSPSASATTSTSPTASTSLRAVGAGELLAYAILCRPDAVLLCPLVAGLAYLDERRPWPLVRILAAMTAGGLLVFLASWAYSGASFVQTLHESIVFEQLHVFPRARSYYFVLLLFTLGAPTLLLLPVGARLAWRAGDADRVPRAIVLIALPTLLLLYFIPTAQEVRHFYPLLAPFVVILVGGALRAIFEERGTPLARARPWLVGGALVLWLMPPVLVAVKDGPRLVFGRFWSPIVWRQYQRDVDSNLESTERIVERAETVPTMTVITVQYDSDHYLQRALWQHGYRPHAAEEAFAGCHGGFEVWRQPDAPGRPGHQVLHARTENAYINQRPLAYTEAIQLQRSFACPAVLTDTPVMVSTLYFVNEAWCWLLDVDPGAPSIHVAYGLRVRALERLGKWLGGRDRDWFGPSYVWRNRTVLLTPPEIAQLRSTVDAVVDAHRLDVPAPVRTYEGVMGLFVARVAWPRSVDGRVLWRSVPTPTVPLPPPPARGEILHEKQCRIPE